MCPGPWRRNRLVRAQSWVEWLGGIPGSHEKARCPLSLLVSVLVLLLSGLFTLRVPVLPSEKWEHSSILMGWPWGWGAMFSKLEEPGNCHLAEVVVGRTALLT